MFYNNVSLTFAHSNIYISSIFVYWTGKPCLLDVQCSVITPGAIYATNEQSNDTADIMKLTRIAENKVCNCNKENYYRFGNYFKKKCKNN